MRQTFSFSCIVCLLTAFPPADMLPQGPVCGVLWVQWKSDMGKASTWVKLQEKKFCIFLCTCIVTHCASFWARCGEQVCYDLVYNHRFSSPKCQGRFFSLRNTSFFLPFMQLLIKCTHFVSLCSVQYFSKLSHKSF